LIEIFFLICQVFVIPLFPFFFFVSGADITLTEESQDVDSDDEALVFKKPPPVSRKRPASKKMSLDVTVV